MQSPEMKSPSSGAAGGERDGVRPPQEVGSMC